jgi:hypothetical protein
MNRSENDSAENGIRPRRPMFEALASYWRRGSSMERVGYIVAGLLIASGLSHLLILLASGGSWVGPVSLRKPATFGLSFGITVATIVWIASFLDVRHSIKNALLGAFSAASGIETSLVTLQAWRGVPSHFNVATPFDALIARVLAGGGLVLVVVIVILTVLSFRSSTAPISLRVALRTGFLTLLAAETVGGLMIAKGMALVLGGHAQAAYAVGGTLKPTHAIAMHGVLILPALAWVLSFANWSERRRLAFVAIGEAGYLLLIGAVISANLSGRNPWQIGSTSSVIFGVGVLAIGFAVTSAIAAILKNPTSDGLRYP